MTHYKVQARGRQGVVNGASTEIWSATIGIIDGGGDVGSLPLGQPTIDALGRESLTAWKTLLGTENCGFPTNTFVDEVRVYQMDPGTNKAIAIGYSGEATTPVGGGHGTASGNAPFQVAVAVSLEANGLRTKPKRGRFYLPAPAQMVDPDGRYNNGYVNNVLAASTLLLQNLEYGFRVVLAGGSQTKTHFAAILSADGTKSSPVGKVRVGHVPDTIRTRRNKLSEAYNERDYPPPA